MVITLSAPYFSSNVPAFLTRLIRRVKAFFGETDNQCASHAALDDKPIRRDSVPVTNRNDTTDRSNAR
ncbi:MAG: hypothetical protein EA426_11690 [Spirochaetaceae bacterium]|nr:MAG: hypothetical protein EA426_11690 [Spirochaetaceae bacterium]